MRQSKAVGVAWSTALPRMHVPTPGMEFPLLSETLEIPSQTHLVVCLQGGFKYSQVDRKD